MTSPTLQKILIAQLGDQFFFEKSLQFLLEQYPNALLLIFPNPSQEKAEVATWLEQFVAERRNNRVCLIDDLERARVEPVDAIVFMYHPFNRYRLRLLQHYYALNFLQVKKYIIANDGYWARFNLISLLGMFMFLGMAKILNPFLKILAIAWFKLFSLLKSRLTFSEYKEIKNWSEDGWGDTRDQCPMMIMDAAEIILDQYAKGQIDFLQARNCNLCGQDKPEILFRSEDGFNYVRCQKCGYTYIKTIVSQLGWQYIEDQHPGWQEVSEMTYLEYARSSVGEQEDRKRFDQYLHLLNKYEDRQGKILDIGCATGNFLKLAKARGWQPLGIERSPLFSTATTKDYDLPVINAKIEDVHQSLLKEHGQFNVITMWETLEHVDDPSLILDIASELLCEQGLIGISIPNMESLYVKLLKERFAPCVGIGHINMFTAKTLTEMLEQKGFTVIYTHTLEPGWDELLALTNLDFRRARSLSGYVAPAQETIMSLREPFVHPVSRLFTQAYSGFLTKLTEFINPGPVLFCIARKSGLS